MRAGISQGRFGRPALFAEFVLKSSYFKTPSCSYEEAPMGAMMWQLLCISNYLPSNATQKHESCNTTVLPTIRKRD